MLKLGRVTKFRMLFLVLVFVLILTYLNFRPPFWRRDLYGLLIFVILECHSIVTVLQPVHGHPLIIRVSSLCGHTSNTDGMSTEINLKPVWASWSCPSACSFMIVLPGAVRSMIEVGVQGSSNLVIGDLTAFYAERILTLCKFKRVSQRNASMTKWATIHVKISGLVAQWSKSQRLL